MRVYGKSCIATRLDMSGHPKHTRQIYALVLPVLNCFSMFFHYFGLVVIQKLFFLMKHDPRQQVSLLFLNLSHSLFSLDSQARLHPWITNKNKLFALLDLLDVSIRFAPQGNCPDFNIEQTPRLTSGCMK